MARNSLFSGAKFGIGANNGLGSAPSLGPTGSLAGVGIGFDVSLGNFGAWFFGEDTLGRQTASIGAGFVRYLDLRRW